MKRYGWLIAVLVLSALALTACGIAGGSDMGDGDITYSYDTDIGGMPGDADAQIEGPAAAGEPAQSTLVMEGSLQTVNPKLELAFPSNIKGRLTTLTVKAGQMVEKGALIAALDDEDVQKEIQSAQRALDRANEDKAKKIKTNETKYNKELSAAQKKYDEAKKKAERALADAKVDLQRAKMKPPTKAVTQAELKLVQAQDDENAAHDNYKKALDRPWDPESKADSWYREWQRKITDRKMAESELQSAKIDLQLYYMGLDKKKQAVTDAETELAQVKIDEVKKDADYTAEERAIEDAAAALLKAQKKLDNLNLYAPWGGLVLDVHTTAGTTVDNGAKIITLLNIQEYYFVTQNLSEQHIPQIHAGQEAKVTLRAYQKQVLPGHVEAVLPKDAKFLVYIRLDSSDLFLLPGMTGKVDIVDEKQ